MGSFTNPLIVEPDDKMEKWTLREGFCYWTGDKAGDGDCISVPAGFVTDFASVPRPLWDVYPPTGLYGKAAVIHDYLYQHGGRFHSNWKDVIYDRMACDRVFLGAMRVLGVDEWTAVILYQAVRYFGGAHFGKPMAIGENT